jgi:hypothetical protein
MYVLINATTVIIKVVVKEIRKALSHCHLSIINHNIRVCNGKLIASATAT